MYIFGNDSKIRGCYSAFNLSTAGGKGSYLELPGNRLLPAGKAPRYAKDGSEFGTNDDTSNIAPGYAGGTRQPPIVVTGVNFAQKEKVHMVQCFSDHSYAYAFGHDPLSSTLEVQFVSFLVNSSGEGWSNIIQNFCYEYKRARLIESQQYAKLWLASTRELKGFVIGMQSATVDAQHNLQRFSMLLMLAEVQPGQESGDY